MRVDQKRRDEVGLQYLNQKSKTKWRSISYWTEDKRSTFIPYISFTHYGDSSILYHKHSFPITSFKNTASGDWENNSNYVSYQLNMLYQKKYKHGQMFSARLDGQLADVTVGGKPVDPKRKYTLATSNYMTGGADHMTALTRYSKYWDSKLLIRDLYIEAAQEQDTLRAVVDGRVQLL